jgi:hypothetical protein
MLRRSAKFTWRLGLLVVIALVVKKLLEAQREPELEKPEPVALPPQWIAPVGTVCPDSHPIKAKLGSKVFRRPGMTGYDASKPERCYASEDAARQDGFKEAKR